MVKQRQNHKCPICLNHIKFQAIIDQCQHIFCQKCIKKWANEENTCPVCKSRFNSISKKPKISKKEKLSKKANKLPHHRKKRIFKEKVKSKDQISSDQVMQQNIIQAFLGRTTRKSQQQMLMAFITISQMASDQ